MSSFSLVHGRNHNFPTMPETPFIYPSNDLATAIVSIGSVSRWKTFSKARGEKMVFLYVWRGSSRWVFYIDQQTDLGIPYFNKKQL